jgi:hypothetical protein
MMIRFYLAGQHWQITKRLGTPSSAPALLAGTNPD